MYVHMKIKPPAIVEERNVMRRVWSNYEKGQGSLPDKWFFKC